MGRGGRRAAAGERERAGDRLAADEQRRRQRRNRGHQPGQDGGEGGDARVHADAAGARQAGGQRRHEAADAPPGGQRPDRRGGGAEHQHLQRDLAHQPGAAGAERRVHRELAAASFHPHQLQVGDVGAGDEEHERHGREQRQQRPPRGADDRILEQADVGDGTAEAAVGLLVAQERLQRRRRLDHRRAGAQPRHEINLAPRCVAERTVGRHGVGGSPDVDAGRIVEVGGHHSDDRETPVAHRDAPAEHGGRGGEPRPPQRVPDHEHRLGAVDVVGRRERPADHRPHAEHLEERTGDERAVDGRANAVLHQHHASDAVGVDAGDRGEVIDVGRGTRDGAIAERMMGVAGRGQVAPRDDHVVLIADRQRPQQDASDQREHEDRGSGAGRERQDRGDGEGARPRQAARDGAGILAPGAKHAGYRLRARSRATVAISSCRSTGLDRCASKPAIIDAARSSGRE